jgi:hypothetical protein
VGRERDQATVDESVANLRGRLPALVQYGSTQAVAFFHHKRLDWKTASDVPGHSNKSSYRGVRGAAVGVQVPRRGQRHPGQLLPLRLHALLDGHRVRRRRGRVPARQGVVGCAAGEAVGEEGDRRHAAGFWLRQRQHSVVCSGQCGRAYIRLSAALATQVCFSIELINALLFTNKSSKYWCWQMRSPLPLQGRGAELASSISIFDVCTN